MMRLRTVLPRNASFGQERLETSASPTVQIAQLQEIGKLVISRICSTRYTPRFSLAIRFAKGTNGSTIITPSIANLLTLLRSLATSTRRTRLTSVLQVAPWSFLQAGAVFPPSLIPQV